MTSPSFLEKNNFLFIAGPCAVESTNQMHQVAQMVSDEGLNFLRGGIYKMRTNPNTFQGLGQKACDIVLAVKKKHNLKFVSEISDPRQIDILMEVSDILQVGTRNMFNYELLKSLSVLDKPIILKRGFCATVKEWLYALEYLVKGGNEKVILCERGIRTFENSTRNTLDLSGALVAQKESSFPVIVDPSHSTGQVELVTPLALATIACGLDGLMIETHPCPKEALSDGFQSLNKSQFQNLIKQIKPALTFVEKKLS